MNAETIRVLKEAGWREDYRLPSNQLIAWRNDLLEFPFHQKAKEALTVFGGLEVNIDGPGETMARQAFRVDPVRASGEHELFRLESERIGKPLYPLGDAEGGAYFLAIADDGSVYALGFDCIDLIGSTVEQAVESLVLGRKGQRLFDGE